MLIGEITELMKSIGFYEESSKADKSAYSDVYRKKYTERSIDLSPVKTKAMRRRKVVKPKGLKKVLTCPLLVRLKLI